MNVSSVKNLNGETFSAVQDTFLTDIVSSNSANWNEISAYQANSASYLNESAFGYDANDKISGYNGSAFAGGSDIPTGLYVPLSATVVAIGETSNSARWFSMVQGRQNTAQENSFAQGVTNSASAASLSQGYANTAYEDSFAQGHWNSAVGGSIAQGNSNSARNHSQAFGRGTVVTNTGMAIGNLNKTYTAAFVVGNGTSLSNRSDAFIINHDGSVSAAGKISANGVELGAGTDLEFEYDAADNISAINSSAISTTPAQALYAQNPLYFSATGTSSYMGINSADLARMLGVDRTVLFEIPYSASTAQSIIASGNITLTESLLNFDRCEIYWAPWGAYGEKRFEPLINICPVVEGSYIPICGHWVVENNGGTFDFYNILSATGNKLYHIEGRFWTPTATAMAGPDSNFKLFKVIGIGRKEV